MARSVESQLAGINSIGGLPFDIFPLELQISSSGNDSEMITIQIKDNSEGGISHNKAGHWNRIGFEYDEYCLSNSPQ
jgi:hypothetical protein